MELVLRLLRRRFGDALTAAHAARIEGLALTEAEALAEALLDFQTTGDLAAWLAQHDRAR